MTNHYPDYAVGTPGKAWGDDEKQQWLALQSKQRSYFDDVERRLLALDKNEYELRQYGVLNYSHLGFSEYPLYCVKVGTFDESKPSILVTGGVHGYETSGVHGAIEFIENVAQQYSDKANIIVLPCISPWAYETINRWNPFAIDPNRSFHNDGLTDEANLAMKCVSDMGLNLIMHIDLHETTDTDNSEFRPALAARDAIEQGLWQIPDGFYTVGDSSRPQADFQTAIIDAVKKVTHIAESDENGKIIGAKIQQLGVINYDKKSLYLCGGFTDAIFVSTTEVYPDSPKATPEICIKAQVAAITGAITYVLDQPFV
ncbi:M14 family metallocarboxypeptidase [Glaciecola sp. MF2-115]|uniref:M14 family metallopeptidase n=1 Tax=Glaciecola sp. MF2-115 TaxID=3384827 RepID=UPI0039A25DC4